MLGCANCPVFDIEAQQVNDAQLAVLETASVESDGLILFDGDRSRFRAGGKRARFNCCDVLLYWDADEEFGVQRVRFGSAKRPLTRAQWRRELDRRSEVIDRRINNICAVYPLTEVHTTLLGWLLLNVEFWKPAPGSIVVEPKEAVAIQNAEKNRSTSMAQAPNVRH